MIFVGNLSWGELYDVKASDYSYLRTNVFAGAKNFTKK